MKRHNQILAGVLILQIALAAFLLWPRSGASGGAVEFLLSDFDMLEVTGITIRDGDGDRVVLNKTGGEWVLADADNYPCDQDKVATFLDQLASITSGRLVARTTSSLARLKVAADDYERRLSLETAGGEDRVLFLGSAPNYNTVHVRLEDELSTYLATGLSANDASTRASAWVSIGYLRVDQESILSLALENGNGSWTFQKDEEGNWMMLGLQEEEAFDLTGFNPVLTRASTINLTEPLGAEALPEYGFDQPSAIATVETAEDTFVLTVGAQDPEDNSYVVKSSSSDYYVRVAEASVRELVERQRADFLLIPAMPTPEGGE
jgi:hypothetical protein